MAQCPWRGRLSGHARASAIALARLGWIQNFLRRYDQAIENLEKAIVLAPDNGDVNATFGQVLNYFGNPARGLQLQEKAFSIDTVVPKNWEFQMGLSHLLLGIMTRHLPDLTGRSSGPRRFSMLIYSWPGRTSN